MIEWLVIRMNIIYNLNYPFRFLDYALKKLLIIISCVAIDYDKMAFKY